MERLYKLYESVTGAKVGRASSGMEYKVTGIVKDLEMRYLRPLHYVPHAGLPVYTIMFLGETGNGKTTLMNALCNFVLGVKMEDPFRYDLANELPPSRNAGRKARSTQSVTKAVASYWIPKTDTNGDLCGWYQFVDTPGFGDTSGLIRDEENTGLIHQFLKSVDYLHAVCFVAHAGTARLTQMQRYIMEKIETLFAKDSIDNTFLLATFKDSGDSQLVDTVNAANFQYNKQHEFNFNNCALYTSGPQQVKKDKFLPMYWDMCVTGAQEFLTTIERTAPFSLRQTKEVHKLREHLQQCMQKLEGDVKVNLRVMTKIQEKKEDIKTYDAEASSTKREHPRVKFVKKKRHEPTPKGRHTTYCVDCVETCHKDCVYENDLEKKNCSAMDEDGHCVSCQAKCPWHRHKHKPYTIEFDVIEVLSEAGKRYDSAIQQKLSAEEAMADLDRQRQDVEAEMEFAIQQAHSALQHLEKIAVSSRIWSLGDYLDFLIDLELKNGRRRNAEHLRHLKDKKMAHHMEDGILKSPSPDAVVKSVVEEEERMDRREKKIKQCEA